MRVTINRVFSKARFPGNYRAEWPIKSNYIRNLPSAFANPLTASLLHPEIKFFFTALMFYTRIPCPKWVDHSAENLNRATRYFPLMGWIVGSGSAISYYGASQLFSPAISLLLSIITGILITGAFHEDGFADVCDGFGGGWTKLKILEIMKDSRLGTYGATGLGLMLSLKFAALNELTRLAFPLFLLTMLTAHSLSRFVAATFIRTMPYARENEDAKAKPVAKGMRNSDFMMAAFWGVAPLAVLCGQVSPWMTLVMVPLLGVRWHLGRYFTKWIGGYTGDCLGAVQQVSEVVIYLTLLAIWKFI